MCWAAVTKAARLSLLAVQAALEVVGVTARASLHAAPRIGGRVADRRLDQRRGAEIPELDGIGRNALVGQGD